MNNSVWMSKICQNRLTPELLTKLFHHSPRNPRTQRPSNTESLRMLFAYNGRVSEL